MERPNDGCFFLMAVGVQRKTKRCAVPLHTASLWPLANERRWLPNSGTVL